MELMCNLDNFISPRTPEQPLANGLTIGALHPTVTFMTGAQLGAKLQEQKLQEQNSRSR